MKKTFKTIKKLLITSALTLSIFSINQINAEAAASYNYYKVQSGDTFWNLSKKFNVSMDAIKQSNNRSNYSLYAGETIKIPHTHTTVTQSEKYLLAQIIHAEAEGESYAGKVAVGTVVLNRVDSDLFPNSIKGVIYQVDNGYYAFSPVKDGRLYNQPSAASMRAAEEALAFRGQGSGSLFFYNPSKTSNQWLRARETTVVIGNHVFAK
ncbi:LysM peptidoglycan-binding domain-containing protein [Bacillus sp. HMF5848]|uniref:cell wall hydrolase n=1 Tax=Bacillus sp. HMF5848 TaxID=2495421 RepID=UPI000F795AD4|nr:cell wall hydrolase [Bacillus sp. HMF5848]RSK27940.1 LysM peptidoglycan-binding domain-containing protein [Bacillus sp. HMF5848]